MKRSLLLCTAMLALLPVTEFTAPAQDKTPLRLVQSIPMPNVKGRIDHMDVDVKGMRLLVAGLENGSLEIVDLRTGKWLRSIPGFKKTQGVAYVASLNKVFVASGDDAMLRVFRGDTFKLLDAVKLDLGPNRVVYDPHTDLIYVGYGGKDAGKEYGEVGVIDAKTDKHIGDIKVDAHPSEILLDQSGKMLFVFVSVASKVQVVDTAKREVVSTWPVSSQRNGDGAFDESTHRLFIGTRTPPQMIAMDSQSGKEVASLPTVEGMDGVYFDAAHERVYVSGGRDEGVGYVFVYQQKDPDHYETLAKIATRPGAGTSFWSPELGRYYVAAPAHDNEDAAILVFEAVP
jgi:DNA-binding beta-propeller fold protein YncE